MNGYEAAFKRMEPIAQALSEEHFSTLNVDIINATSLILGASHRILSYRDRIAILPEFDISHVETLIDRAHAAWYVHVTNLPEPEPADFQNMLNECTALRSQLLKWTVPLVHIGLLSDLTIKHIKEGSGHKQIPSDLLALVSLFQSKWSTLEGQCGVTKQQLERGAILAPQLFYAIGRREDPTSTPPSESTLRLRRFWTLADRAYDQCRRAIQYLEWSNPNAAELLPSLRKNAGPKRSAQEAQVKPELLAHPAVAETVIANNEGGIGEGDGPFVNLLPIALSFHRARRRVLLRDAPPSYAGRLAH